MPYELFTRKRKGRKEYCTRNKENGRVVCYSSAEKRKTGIRIRTAIHHGWKPTGKRKRKR